MTTPIQSNTRAIIQLASEMTIERALQMINANHARTPLTADQIYVFRMELSNQNLDSHKTRMSEKTLNNYAQDFTEGRALMNSHRTGGFANSPELPLGRTFFSEVSGSPLPQTAAYEASGGARLAVYSYIPRDLSITAVNTNDAIRGIDSGVINDGSVGFTLGDNGRYICNLCGSDLMDYESCTHFPGREYNNGRCFAWVDNARGREASLVYKGSTPDAMIDKVIRLVNDGQMPEREARMIGEEWGVRIFGEKNFTVVKPEENTERKENIMNWEELLKSIRALDAGLADRLTALPENERGDALVAVLREKQTTIESLQPRAALGDKYIADLIEEAAKARTRAEGNDFDAEKYKSALKATGDVDYIRSEIASWERVVRGVFGNGKRPTGSRVAQNNSSTGTSRSYRG